eukprot:m.311884 g.311884  ORF g.311884 m.311884 type:complete len:120 (-) comp20232_c0_seq6:114-473(-)
MRSSPLLLAMNLLALSMTMALRSPPGCAFGMVSNSAPEATEKISIAARHNTGAPQKRHVAQTRELVRNVHNHPPLKKVHMLRTNGHTGDIRAETAVQLRYASKSNDFNGCVGALHVRNV